MEEVTLAGEVVAANGRDATTLATMFGITSAAGEVSCSPPVPGTGVPVPSAGAAEPQVTVVTCRLDDDEDVTCTIAISVLPPGGVATGEPQPHPLTPASLPTVCCRRHRAPECHVMSRSASDTL